MTPQRRKIMVFGVFARLHDGHRAFLAQAREFGDELVAVVCRDSVARTLKNKLPEEIEVVRCVAVEEIEVVSRAILGDEELGSYQVLFQEVPDVICVGYDQDELEADLKRRMEEGSIPVIPLVRLAPHKPDVFHTSLL